MIKNGILNPAVNSLISRVRHTNTLVIADRGFPFWPEIETADRSLVDDVPTVLQVLDGTSVGPTIFALGIRGVGEHTKFSSSLIVMSIVGGALAPPFMEHVADLHSMRVGFVVPLVCFVFIALYGYMWPRLCRFD